MEFTFQWNERNNKQVNVQLTNLSYYDKNYEENKIQDCDSKWKEAELSQTESLEGFTIQ